MNENKQYPEYKPKKIGAVATEWSGKVELYPVQYKDALCRYHRIGWDEGIAADRAMRAAQPEPQRQYICPTESVADLVNNLLLLDQTLPIYAAQSITHDGKRRTITVPPIVSRERVKEGRWIGEGDELNAAVIWTRAEQPDSAAVAVPSVDRSEAVNLARNVKSYGAKLTMTGIKVLAKAVMEMDAALAAPTTQAPQPQCSQCKKSYRKQVDGVGCPKCAPGVVVDEAEFQKPIQATQPEELPLYYVSGPYPADGAMAVCETATAKVLHKFWLPKAVEPAVSQGEPPLLKRALELHEKAFMPWADAEELALKEAGIEEDQIDELIGNCAPNGLGSLLCDDDELREFTRSVLVHQPKSTAEQHDRDSAELRRLCQARDEARRERDLLRVENAELLRRATSLAQPQEAAPTKMPIPPSLADPLDVVYAEGWNAACDAFFGGKPPPDPLVVTVTQAAPSQDAEDAHDKSRGRRLP